MSASFTLDVVCDYRDPETGDGCGAWELGVSGVERAPTMRDARAEVAEVGWTRGYAASSCGYDLCPEHARLRPGVDFPDWRK